MDWTPELDAQLIDMHNKRVGVRFIASWTRWPAAAIRTRLVELGLAKPLSRRPASAAAPAAIRRSVRPLVAAPRCAAPAELATAEDDEDECDLRGSRGCPRGYLVSEAQIAELYQGQLYR
jgi:hypothetical protein